MVVEPLLVEMFDTVAAAEIETADVDVTVDAVVDFDEEDIGTAAGFVHGTFAGGGCSGDDVLIVTPILPDSFESTSALRLVPTAG